MNPDKLPPYSEECEQGVLGCILLDWASCLPEVTTRLKATKEAFYDGRHQAIFDCFVKMQGRSIPIDIITANNCLKDLGILDQVGGRDYISQLADKVPSAHNLGYYLDTVFEKWVLRKMLRTCYEASAQLTACEGNVSEVVAKVQDAFMDVPSPNPGGIRHIGDYAQNITEQINRYEECARGVGMITGLRTGFWYWDHFCGGLHPKELTVLGGDPGAGKTSLAMNVAERVAIDGNCPVGVLSLEMSADDLILRLLCCRTRVNFHKLRTGYAKANEIDVLRQSLPRLTELKECPIFIDDSGGINMFEVRARLRTLVHRHKIKLAIIDYLQLIALTKEQMFLGMAAAYAEVARSIQQSAKELGIPIIVLSQLNNEARKRKKNEKPKLTDFRETGAIGDVANFAGILWREPMEPEEEAKLRNEVNADVMGQHEMPISMEVVKNKNGPSGTGLDFKFLRWCMRFEDLKKESKPEAKETHGKE